MIWGGTWPTYTWSDEEACRKMISHYHLDKLVSFGKTKVFIKTPRTVYYLEEERERRMPGVVSLILYLRYASTHKDTMCNSTCRLERYLLSRLALLDNIMQWISNRILFASFLLIL